jgi:hypothetical protein
VVPDLQRVRSYYERPAVRARIAEYCGGLENGLVRCWGLAGFGGAGARTEPDGAPTPLARPDLRSLLDEAADVCRSMADLRGTVVALDLDYMQPGRPTELYEHPENVFSRIEPVHRAVQEQFRAYGIRPRVLLTGRGYHYVFRASWGSPLQTALTEIGVVSETMRSRRPPPGVHVAQARLLARAHDGAGRLLEHLAHGVLRAVQGQVDFPVALADLPPPHGGPFVCLDLSAYGDPLWTRYTRCAFSTHQKAWMQQATEDDDRRICVVIPRENEPLEDRLRIRRDLDAAAALAARCSATLPDVTEAPAWIEEYRTGPLGRFHAEFDRGPELGRELWPFTYDRLARPGLPGCLRYPLESPNPFLLRPACLRTVALTLWGLGWHPRSIAALVRSRFEKDFGWRPSFSKYDAGTRASFYVRVLCGALRDGLEDPHEFDCQAQAARGLCEPASCSPQGARTFAGLAAALATKEHDGA